MATFAPSLADSLKGFYKDFLSFLVNKGFQGRGTTKAGIKGKKGRKPLSCLSALYSCRVCVLGTSADHRLAAGSHSHARRPPYQRYLPTKACEGKRTPFSQQSRELLKGVVPVDGSSLGKSICGVNDRVIFLGCCSLAYATIGVTK